MKTPTFWNKPGIISTLLLPIGWIYALLTRIRIMLVRPKKVNIPVICIGNLTAGGTGKTPVSISLAEMLQAQKLNPYFISRGYGGSLKGVLVDNSKHQPKDVGDEPLLLSKQAPVVVNSDRIAGAQLAQENGADILIMDDGFQNPYLYKDISFIVVDGALGFGNRRPIPSGPLRESLTGGLKRADAIIIIGEDKQKRGKFIDKPIFRGTMEPSIKTLKGEKIIAFAGIGRPSKFYYSLIALEAILIKTIDFPDHHTYTVDELEQIIQEAKTLKASIYTTSKDFVKIPTSLQKHFQVLEITIKWENPKSLMQFIHNKLDN